LLCVPNSVTIKTIGKSQQAMSVLCPLWWGIIKMFGVGVIEGLKKWIEVSYQAIDFLFHTWSLYVTKFSSQITWFGNLQ